MKKKKRLKRILTDIRVLSSILDETPRKIIHSGDSYYMTLTMKNGVYYAMRRIINDIYCMAEMKENE